VEAKVEVGVVEVQLPPIGQTLKNVTVSPAPASDPPLLPDSAYPEWIWKARGPCRATLRSSDLDFNNEVDVIEGEGLAGLKKYLRTENRRAIRKNNSLLKGASQ